MATATVTAPIETDKADAFYKRMGTLCLAMAVAGFLPSYWMPMARGTLDIPLAVHAHGALFLGWLILFRVQAGLIGSGRTAVHRRIGFVGAIPALLMIDIVFEMQVMLVPRFDAEGFHEAARGFAWINVSDMILFGGLIVAALLNVRRRDVHKRLMLAATLSLMAVPIGRMILTLGQVSRFIPQDASGPPPLEAAYLPHALSWLLVVVAMWRDHRQSRPLHPAYITSLAAMMFQMATLAWIGRSAIWARVVDSTFLPG
ncbi:MAG: hypothetical protein QHC40_12745 [Sphingobium sp.]|nr:hypothetical protein [Sphingobium sp.]